jgi:PIN domain nuclease of toxin-antitoxin system
MRLLLDTHIWIWNAVAPEKLGKRVAKAIQDERNQLWLSPISIWELTLLVEKSGSSSTTTSIPGFQELWRNRRFGKP